MPITNLVLRGISRAVSDINTPDGATAELINAVVENDEIRPITAPALLEGVTIKGQLLAIQQIEDNRRVFISATSQGGTSQNETWIHFTDSEGGELATHSISGKYSDLSATVMDNVVVVSAAFGMYYFIYRDGRYIALGQRPPFPKLSFGLVSNGMTSDSIDEIQMSETEFADGVITDSGLRQLYAAAQAKIAKFLSDCRENNHFVFPFFVRYALRLFDGSGHILHSAPILINPSSDEVPFSLPCELIEGTSVTGFKKWELGLRGTSASLQFHSMSSQEDIEALKKWRDLVTHIDIFASAPIYSYKELTPDYQPTPDEYDTEVGLSESQYRRKVRLENYGAFYGRSEYKNIGNILYPEESHPEWELVLPSYTQEKQYEEVTSTSLFYHICSLPIDELGTYNNSSWEDVPIEGNALENLVTRRVLSDDYDSHVGKRGGVMEVYNDRLVLANMAFSPFDGYPLSTMRPCISRDTLGKDDDIIFQSAVVLHKGIRRITVHSPAEDLTDVNKPQISGLPYGFYYYPDTDAKEITIPTLIEGLGEGTPGYKTYELTPHPTLNGAYLFLGYPKRKSLPDIGDDLPDPSSDTDRVYGRSQDVYQSVAGNPFRFPLEGITSIGNTPVISLIASSIEVSTGQFGDFPMYAFTEDGVWVLSLDKEGWIVSQRLISNDVCLGKSTVVALNRPVIFGSPRGLMLLEGSKITCLSDVLLGPRMGVASLPDIERVEGYYPLLLATESHESFNSFLAKEAFFTYDYAHNRVLIMNPTSTYAYVLSLSSLEFSKVAVPIFSSAISHYSGAYLQGEQGLYKIRFDVDTEGDETKVPVIAITRPVKFGDMNLKSIKRMLTRHNSSDSIGMVLYGSRGDATFHRVTSLYGRAYKYYIIALFGQMTPQERITCITVDWDSKFTNKLR